MEKAALGYAYGRLYNNSLAIQTNEGSHLLERITFDLDVMSGKPCIRGMPVTVAAIVDLLASGSSTHQILAAYPEIEPEDITAALAYAKTSIPSDTSIDAEQVQRGLLREKSPSERAGMALRLSSDVIRAGKRAIARAHPQLTDRQVGRKFIELHYGQEIGNMEGDAWSESRMEGTSELVRALRPVVDELHRLGVRYYVGGSVASSIHGAVRSTLDVDIAAELDEESALALVAALQSEFYVSEQAVLDAVRRRACFNLIHLATSFKVDVFVSQERAFDRLVQERAVLQVLGEANNLSARVATAEDTILFKLEWYRLGHEISERQWNDLTLVAKLQGPRLDHEYLHRWASELGVADLLGRLLSHIEPQKR